MSAFLLRRLAGVLAVVAAPSVLIFGVIHVLPGDVGYPILGEFATPDSVARLQQRLGPNDPMALPYWHWLSGLLHGDLGPSLTMDSPAGLVIVDALGHSAVLAGLAFVLVAGLGIGFGVYAASQQDRAATT